MAKLPGWEPSISTAMPRKSPAQRGAPAMVRPAVQQFVPLDNPNDYLRLGNAKADKYSAMGGAVSAAANVFANIADAEETAAAELAVSEYIEDRSANQAALANSEFSTTDADGNEVYPWMGAVDEYDEYASQYQKDLLSSRKWGKKSQQIIKLKMSATDATFRSKTASFVRDRTVDKARSDTISQLDIASKNGDFNTINTVTARGRRNNTLGQKEATELNIKYTEKAWGDLATTSINALRQKADKIPQSQFKAQYHTIADMLLDDSFGASLGVKQKLMKQLTDLNNDYEDRIVEEREQLNTATAIIEQAQVIANGDPVAIQAQAEYMKTPAAAARLGAAGHAKVAGQVAEAIQFGITSPDTLQMLGNLERDLEDGRVPEAQAMAMVNQRLADNQISQDDYRKAVVMIGSKQNALIKEATRVGKDVIWKNIVNSTEAEFTLWPQDRQNKNRATKMRAQTAVQKYNRKLKMAAEGRLPLPDPQTMALQIVAESYYIEPFMVNSEGKKAADVWEIDRVQAETQIEERYQRLLIDQTLTIAAEEREMDMAKLARALDVQNNIQRPDDE